MTSAPYGYQISVTAKKTKARDHSQRKAESLLERVSFVDMAKDEIDESMPDKDVSRDFYAKYEPKEILGRGVSSTVRRCIEKETGREYAAKIIDVSGENEEEEGFDIREDTVREISVLKLVAGHPYIIELHDVFESSTFIFLVFELCKNGELFDYLTKVVTLSEKKTKFMMRQLFEAVEYIHSKNIVHRDLKPENILLDDDMNIKLTDFGFAKVLSPKERLFDLCGTPGYLAPELLKSSMHEAAEGYGKEVDMLIVSVELLGTPNYIAPEVYYTGMYDDPRGYSIIVDEWACGVIMYTVLVGCPPFWHRKQMIMLRNIMEGNYSFCSPEWDDITDTPKDLISKLLTVDPSKRITIKDALAHEFFQILSVSRAMHADASGDSTYKGRPFNARQKFKFAILCVRCVIRIKRLKYTPEPVAMETVQEDPYKVKPLRKAVDGCAFSVYGHWVKKGEAQNRAALFENVSRTEKSTESISHSPIMIQSV